MSERRRLAEERMEQAKRQFSEAARAALAGDTDAPELARVAFARICEARTDLAAAHGAPQ